MKTITMLQKIAATFTRCSTARSIIATTTFTTTNNTIRLLSTTISPSTCQLCKSSSISHLLTENDPHLNLNSTALPVSIHYHRCNDCCYVFQDEQSRLTPDNEKIRYNEHNNDPNDSRYRKFLSPLANAVVPFLKPNAIGLDFGCGPGPTLSLLMEEKGFACKNYDPFFYPNLPDHDQDNDDDSDERLSMKYDYILSSEVFEHLHDPRKELKYLNSLLKKNGVLGIMTSRVNGDVDGELFEKWWYRRDPTHVGFFARESFIKVRDDFFPNASVEFPSKSITVIRKNEM